MAMSSGLPFLRAVATPGSRLLLSRKMSTSRGDNVLEMVKALQEALRNPDSGAAIAKASKIVETLSPALKAALDEVAAKETPIGESHTPAAKALDQGVGAHELRLIKLEVSNAQWNRVNSYVSTVLLGLLVLGYAELHQEIHNRQIADSELQIRLVNVERHFNIPYQEESKVATKPEEPVDFSVWSSIWSFTKKVLRL